MQSRRRCKGHNAERGWRRRPPVRKCTRACRARARVGGGPIKLAYLGGGGGRLLHLSGSGRGQPQAAGLPWAARSAL